jgi:hypothetical protein
MPTLPGYRESWAEQDLVSIDGSEDMEKNRKSFDFEDEKRLTVREKDMGKGIDFNLSMIVDKGMDMGHDVDMHHFDDDLSAVVEEEEEDMSRSKVGVAETTDIQALTRVQTGDLKGIEYKKL